MGQVITIMNVNGKCGGNSNGNGVTRKGYRGIWRYEKGDETKSEIVNSKYDNWVVEGRMTKMSVEYREV